MRPLFANNEDEAVKYFGKDFKKIEMDVNKKLVAGNVNVEKLGPEELANIEQMVSRDALNPLNGKYAINGVADALVETSDSLATKSMVGKMYENFILYPKATSQIAKTILSVQVCLQQLMELFQTQMLLKMLMVLYKQD